MALNPKDANDMAVSSLGLSAVWIGENAVELVGMACTVVSLVFIVRRYYGDREVRKLQAEKLRLEIKNLRDGE